MTDHHRDEFEAWCARDPNVPAGLRWDSPIILSYWRCWQESRRTYRASVLEEAAKVCEALKDQKNEFGARTKNHYGPVIATGALMCAQAIRRLATQTPPCRGTACGTTTGEHSAECVAEHARAVAGLPRV